MLLAEKLQAEDCLIRTAFTAQWEKSDLIVLLFKKSYPIQRNNSSIQQFLLQIFALRHFV